jgi:hypothetical protein
MKAYLANTFSEEEGPMAVEGKTVYINASKEEIKKLAKFLDKVATYVENNDLCHMQFRDYEPDWNKKNYIDVAIELVNENT